MATTSAPLELKQTSAPAKVAQIRVSRRSPAYWRVTVDNPPINVMGPEMVREFQEVIDALEADKQVISLRKATQLSSKTFARCGSIGSAA
jgi:hypothetical protein